MDRNDLVETDHVKRHYSGSTMYLMHNSQQKFYYMSRQSKNEVLMFKNFDSDPGVEAKCKFYPTVSTPMGLSEEKSHRCAACVFSSSPRNSRNTATRKHRSQSVGVYTSRRKPCHEEHIGPRVYQLSYVDRVWGQYEKSGLPTHP